jgi:hypothetical protein
VKRCACCGREYAGPEDPRLTPIGEQVSYGEALDLANCPCGSTLGWARPIPWAPTLRDWMRDQMGAEVRP